MSVGTHLRSVSDLHRNIHVLLWSGDGKDIQTTKHRADKLANIQTPVETLAPATAVSVGNTIADVHQ